MTCATESRVVLVPLAPGHAGDLLPLLSDGETMDAFGIERFEDEAEIRLWIRGDRWERTLTSLAILEGRAGPAIGLVRIQREGSVALVGYAIAPDRRREGLMAEALQLAVADTFRDPAVQAVMGHVDPDNRPSLALLAKLGFREEPHRRWDAVSRRHLSVHRLDRP